MYYVALYGTVACGGPVMANVDVLCSARYREPSSTCSHLALLKGWEDAKTESDELEGSARGGDHDLESLAS